MNLASAILTAISLLLLITSALSIILMLYAWEDKGKGELNGAPRSYVPPRLRFSVLLPARHEEAVIQDTIQRLVDLNYPRELVQILIVIEAGDGGTIAKVNAALTSLRAQGINHVRLLTFSEPPINKPHGLNVGLAASTGDVVTIFDAEDEPHRDILQLVNTAMVREDVRVLQCGVQLMNYGDRWFAPLNVLEYFFWFRSRMHFHATTGAVLLGGNTVFIERDLLEQLHGWDAHCLTEDADIGIRLSMLGIPIRVLYDDQFVTREETPTTTAQFIKQRTRWNQGFLQILMKGDWLKLPSWNQRLLAFYSLAFPLMQALTVLYLPISIWLAFFAKVSVPLVMLSFLPLYLLLVQLGINVIGLYEFTSAHKLRPSLLKALLLVVSFLPYQYVLSFAAIRALWRHLRGVNSWEKTRHVGAHRVQPAFVALPQETGVLDSYGDRS